MVIHVRKAVFAKKILTDGQRPWAKIPEKPDLEFCGRAGLPEQCCVEFESARHVA